MLFVLMMTLLFSPLNIDIMRVYANPDMFPSDCDAWTENNNATYPWKCSTSYPDGIRFVASKKHDGSYSLRVNHTSSTTRMQFQVDIGSSQDVSSYWALKFYIRFERSDNKKIIVYVSDNENFAYPYFTITIKPSLNDWYPVVLPLNLFVGKGTNPSWTSIRYIRLYVSQDIGQADGTKVYVDGLHFVDSPTAPTVRNSIDYTALANLYSAAVGAEKSNIIYNSTSYTTLYDWMKTDSSPSEGKLEAEALGQTIYAFSWIYSLTSIDTFLDKAELYGDWLLNFQNSTYGFFSYEYNNATGTFSSTVSVTVSGWCLAGLSVLYGQNSNSTIKTACDLGRRWLVDYMWNWTDLGKGWYVSWDHTSGKGYGSQTVVGMYGGGGQVGLSTYYTYVSQNATVKDVLIKAYSRHYSLLSANRLGWGTFEQSAYNLNGFYWDCVGQSNSTYWDNTLKYMTEELKQYTMIFSNGSMPNYKYCTDSSGWDYLVNWGLAVELPILYKVYENYDSSPTTKLFLENTLFDWVVDCKGTHWYFPFDTSTYKDVSWTPTQAFVYLAYLMYYQDEVPIPYAVTTDANLTSSSYSSNQLTLIISSSSGTTSTTEVYCGDKEKPNKVLLNTNQYAEGNQWSYDIEAKILTVTWTHSSELDVDICWKGGGPSRFNVHVEVTKDGLPTHAIVCLQEQNRTIFFQTKYRLPYGNYLVTVYCGDESQTKELGVYAHITIGFNFGTPKKHVRIL